MTGFLLDANVFIQASRLYYPFDVCPGFWRSLVVHHTNKRVFSIDRIRKELEVGGDRLKEWVKDTAPPTFFKKTDDKAVIALFQEMVTWVANHRQFDYDAKSEFAVVADGWLVAFAKRNGLVVVTQEVHNPQIKVKVPIPNLCVQYKVPFTSTFGMLRELKVKFVLRKKRQT